MKFYICNHCKNLVYMVKDVGVPIVCCGQKMEELKANTVEASGEKHIPVAKFENGVVSVNVGSVDHPMLPEHYIEWVALETEKGAQIVYLKPEQKPSAEFCVGDDKPVAVYAYCNLHGLWKSEI